MALDASSVQKQLDQGDTSASTILKFLSLVKEQKLRKSEAVAKYGMLLLRSPANRANLGSTVWNYYEQVCMAALDVFSMHDAEHCLTTLQKKFPNSSRVARLQGMFYEAKGEWKKAETTYKELLEKDPADTSTHKRVIALLKGHEGYEAAIKELTKYLDTFQADSNAWAELAECYLAVGLYKQAMFCYEELVLASPLTPLYHVKLAEVLFTLGGADNIGKARRYFSAAVELSSGTNKRALYGICLCCQVLGKMKNAPMDEETEALHRLASSALVRAYGRDCPQHQPLVRRTFGLRTSAT
mmetsp:Transcript_5315/g.19441  ORF Transcript_5315/g.19441 Transcript_5315/m.19441 type:complete len:299 (+) Transcript_5315:116-1012(+)